MLSKQCKSPHRLTNTRHVDQIENDRDSGETRIFPALLSGDSLFRADFANNIEST